MSKAKTSKDKKVLWVEDDHFHLKYLMYQLERDGYTIDIADSAFEGYLKGKNWREYAVVIVDLILPLTGELVTGTLPSEVRRWDEDEYLGANLVRWLLKSEQVSVPIVLLTVVNDPIERYHLQDLHISGYLKKSALKPSIINEYISNLLEARDMQPA